MRTTGTISSKSTPASRWNIRTEVITGIDSGGEQIRIAAENRLFLTKRCPFRGYAIELRINAEDPKNNFLANPVWSRSISRPAGTARAGRCHLQGYEIPGSRFDAHQADVYGFTGAKRWIGCGERSHCPLSSAGFRPPSLYYKQIVNDPDFIEQRFDTRTLKPQHLLDYQDEVRNWKKLARFVAEINAHGYNRHAVF